MSAKLIGLVGLAGSGKSSVAEVLARRGFVRAAFADELKRIAREQFGWDGQKDERGRRLLQVLGTEAGRAYDPDIWTKRLFARIDPLLAGAAPLTYELRRPPGIPGPETAHVVSDAPAGVVIDDVRFQNEVDAIRARGGRLILVTRSSQPLLREKPAHESEHLAWDWTWWGIGDTGGLFERIRNDDSLAVLETTTAYVVGYVVGHTTEP